MIKYTPALWRKKILCPVGLVKMQACQDYTVKMEKEDICQLVVGRLFNNL